MTELSSIRTSDITQEAFRTVIQIKVKKGKKLRLFEIILNRKDDICCAAKAIEQWLTDNNCAKRNDIGIWWDFEKKRTLGGIRCSKELKVIIRDAEISKQYAGMLGLVRDWFGTNILVGTPTTGQSTMPGQEALTFDGNSSWRSQQQ
ncbi:MAG: hypothetical protein EZS28_031826 [Streblomastix strix]|uniref:Uncharacterized protein n=1 Tax=Streblomastix strix TaxID=222440 RepID=A0A5J4UPK8_9EUKA|nr:MAG: hypothetical protein EZS28_031826 [Streblomastix strix]